MSTMHTYGFRTTLLMALFTAPAGTALADFVINDDLIVDGSACVGFDCVNGESFSFDTIRLKENNLRIKFDDTSVAASFPRNDWQLTANASANGGASKFSIDDITGGRTPFTIEANARSHSLYVDDGGRLGLRTSTPSTEIHTVDGDTPTLRLQQDGSSGFAPQTWDVAGNETNFFVRDVTNGSTLPFRIRPGAPTSSIFIDVDGDVGLATASPDADLHVNSSSDTTTVRIEATGGVDGTSWDIDATETSGAAETGDYVRLVTSEDDMTNATALEVGEQGRLRLYNSFNSVVFEAAQDGSFTLTNPGVANALFVDGATGNATFNGSVTATSHINSSSRALKDDFATVDPQQVLLAVAGLEIAEWSFKKDKEVRHIGPVAEEFYEAFGLGTDAQHIATVDSDGVALASIQALHQNQLNKDKEIDRLKGQLKEIDLLKSQLQVKDQQLQAMSKRLQRLETALSLTASIAP